MNTSPMKVTVSCPVNGRKKQGSKKWLTQSYSRVWFEPKFISSSLPPMTFSGYFLSGFVWGFNLGKEQIIHSFIHDYIHFSEVHSPPGSFERKADPLGTGAVDHAFREPSSWTTLFLRSPWGCSVDSQRWTKCLSSSRLPKWSYTPTLGPTLDESPLLTTEMPST